MPSYDTAAFAQPVEDQAGWSDGLGLYLLIGLLAVLVALLVR